MKRSIVLCFCIVFFAFSGQAQTTLSLNFRQTILSIAKHLPQQQSADQLISFAKTLIGIPYKYASSNPQRGFDCSGFVNYVFKNFGFDVPRSSTEFTSAGTPIALENAKVGDVLLFTGSNPKVRKIGHVGIICSIDGDHIQFIHSTSGKEHGVTITTMNAYYKSRFMKAVSII